jgi:polysaccharide biosynthesis protein PslH
MKVLFIAPRIPFPLLQGDRLICYYRLKALSQQHQITLLTFYQSEKDLQYLAKIEDMCHEVHAIHLPKWQSIYNCATNTIGSKLPFQVAYYRSTEFQTALNRITTETKFDIVHYFLLRMAEYRVPSEIVEVIDLIDSMQLNLSSRLKVEKPITKFFVREELRRMTSYELDVVSRFKNAILVSQRDAEYFQKSGKEIDVIPLGIDIDLFRPQPPNVNSVVRLIFAGHMSYSPNIYAVQWFIENCWLKVQDSCPNTQFIIAGADAPAEIVNLGDRSHIMVTGRVDSMADTLSQSDIAVVPMQSGSGMQFKILEAMSCGLPVITTSFGLGTIKAVPDQQIVVADTADDFISRVVELVRDAHKRVEIGRNARIFIEENHSWHHAAAKIRSIYQAVECESIGYSTVKL